MSKLFEEDFFNEIIDELVGLIAGFYMGIESHKENPGGSFGKFAGPNGIIPVDKGLMRSHFTKRSDDMGNTGPRDVECLKAIVGPMREGKMTYAGYTETNKRWMGFASDELIGLAFDLVSQKGKWKE